MNSPRVTAAVVGLGSIGLRHAGNLIGLGCAVVGYDPDPARRALLSERGGTPASSRDQALSSADVAVIATPHDSHLEHLRASLQAGCHTFVEKPIAHVATGVPEALDLARSRELKVFVGFNLRFHPGIVHACALLRDGALGTPLWGRLIASSYLPDWRPGQDHRTGYAADPLHGGVLFDFVHEFDLANHLLGPARVLTAAARCSGALDIPSDDIADVVLQHGDGVMTNLHVDFVTRPRCRVAEICGTEGLLRVDLDRRQLQLSAVDGRELQAESFPGDYAGDYVEEMRAFIHATAGEASDLCTGQQGLAALEQVVDARRMAGLPV